VSKRICVVLAAGALMLLAAGCSGGDDEKTPHADASSSGPAPGASRSAPEYAKYSDFPGKDFATTEPGLSLGVRVKPIDTAWSPELAGVSADAGKHFFAVYVAVTGELADRGVNNAKLDYLRLKYKPTDPICGPEQSGYCFRDAYPKSQLADLQEVQQDAGGQWRDYAWHNMSVMGTNVSQGSTMLGVVGFSVSDDEKATGFELCGPTQASSVDTDNFACVPIDTPERSQ
jgi:hypothetical protein